MSSESIVTDRNSLDDDALDQIFREARTHIAWLDLPVTDELLREAVELAKLGPTSANCLPMRIVFVRSKEAKERLRPALAPGNVDKTMAAPATAIIGYDLEFCELLPRLFPRSEHAQSLRWQARSDQRHRVSQQLVAGRLLHFGAAIAGPRHRPDVGLRQRESRCRVFLGHRREIQLPDQYRSWLPRKIISSQPKAQLRENRAHCVRATSSNATSPGFERRTFPSSRLSNRGDYRVAREKMYTSKKLEGYSPCRTTASTKLSRSKRRTGSRR